MTYPVLLTGAITLVCLGLHRHWCTADSGSCSRHRLHSWTRCASSTMIRRVTLLDLFGIELPVVQAPMAGSSGSALALAVAMAGGLGSLPCAMLTSDQVRDEVAAFRSGADRPFNLNFFCHAEVRRPPNRRAVVRPSRGYYDGARGGPARPA